MDVVLIVFMVLAGIVCVFSVAVVVIDLVQQKRQASGTQEEELPAPPDPPVAEEREEELSASQPEEEQALPGENAIVFSASERKTLDEQFRELDERLQRYYVEIVQYAMAQEGSKQYKNVRYEEYKIRKTRLVRLQIKRGTVVCEFILLNEDFKNYIQDNKVRIRQAPTVLRVEDEAAVAIAKNSIDIAVRAAEDELEYKKQKRREKRRQARQREDTQEG